MTARRQLVLDLPHRTARGRDDFLVAPCNEEAVGWIDLWPDWPGPALVLCGPSGCGKSHLAAVWQARTGARALDASVLAEVPADHDKGSRHWLVENGAAPADEGALFHLYNRTADRGGTLLVTASVPPSRWSIGLADLASRLRAAPVAAIGRPDDALIEALLVKMFADRQLRIGPEVIAYLLPRMERSFAAVRGLVERLDEASLSQRREINVPLARSVLAENGSGGT